MKLSRYGYLFVLPPMGVYFIYIIYPILHTFFIGFTDWKGVGEVKFIGFSNYIQMFKDPVFWILLRNFGVWFGITTVTMLSIGLVLAILLNMSLKGGTIYKVIIFIPVTLSQVVTGFAWSFILNPDFGPINPYLKALGLGFLAQPWLVHWPTNLIASAIAYTWQYAGVTMVIYLAGLQTIPKDLYEAASIDGAGVWATFRKITLPSLKPMTVTLVIFSIVGTIYQFTFIWFLTGGGPAHATAFFSTYYFTRAFRTFEFGYASTLASFAFILALIITIIYYRFSYRRRIG